MSQDSVKISAAEKFDTHSWSARVSLVTEPPCKFKSRT